MKRLDESANSLKLCLKFLLSVIVLHKNLAWVGETSWMQWKLPSSVFNSSTLDDLRKNFLKFENDKFD